MDFWLLVSVRREVDVIAHTCNPSTKEARQRSDHCELWLTWSDTA